MTTKVEFSEQSKGVVCKVWVEGEPDKEEGDNVLAEAKRLYHEASKFSQLKTFEKIRK